MFSQNNGNGDFDVILQRCYYLALRLSVGRFLFNQKDCMRRRLWCMKQNLLDLPFKTVKDGLSCKTDLGQVACTKNFPVYNSHGASNVFKLLF